VKLVWGREDDMRAGYYRPMYYHSLEAGLDAQGRPIAWRHTIVGQSILAGTRVRIDAGEGRRRRHLGGRRRHPALRDPEPRRRPALAEDRRAGAVVALGRLHHTAFATECFLDEIARTTKKDPLQLRRALLVKHPRHKAVLELAAQKAGWGRPLAGSKDAGRSRGIAVHESFQYLRRPGGERFQRKKTDPSSSSALVCAVDCGVAVNPNIIAMQIGVRHRLRPVGRADGRNHAEGRAASSSPTSTTTRCCAFNQMPRALKSTSVSSKEKPTGGRRARHAGDRTGARKRDRSRSTASGTERCRLSAQGITFS